MENLAHNVARNIEVEERKKVDVQVCFVSKPRSRPWFSMNVLIGIYLGETRSFLIRTSVSAVLKIRPHYTLGSYLQSLAGPFNFF